MDVAGLVIGAVALASLFSTCLECFDMIEAGQNISRDLDIAMVKLDSLRVIFLIWGNVVGLHGVENTFNKEILGPDVQRTIYRLLSNLKVLFQDAERFRDRYGVEQIRGVDAPESSTSAGSLTTRNVGNLNSSHAHLGRMRNRTSWRAKVKWAIRDKKKFTVLLDDMKELIQQLRDITQAAADLQSQRRAFMAEVSIISDIETLEVLEEASVEEDPELSEVASQRILQLTEGSVASSGRTQSLFTESIYYSARTDAYTHSNTRDLRSEPSTVYDPREGITRNEFVETTELRLLETEHHGNDESDFAFSQRNNLKLIQEEDKLAFYMESFGGSRYQDILSPHREFLELKKLATGYGDRIISGDNRKMLFALLRDLAQNPPPLISFRAECPTLVSSRCSRVCDN